MVVERVQLINWPNLLSSDYFTNFGCWNNRQTNMYVKHVLRKLIYTIYSWIQRVSFSKIRLFVIRKECFIETCIYPTCSSSDEFNAFISEKVYKLWIRFRFLMKLAHEALSIWPFYNVSVYAASFMNYEDFELVTEILLAHFWI